MTDEYAQAIVRAKKELAEYDAEFELLERKRAKLRQTIAVLQSLLGNESPNDQSLTEAILTVAKAANGFITTIEVIDRLTTMGFGASSATVATILSRLTKAGHLLNGIGVGGNGYMWVGPSGEANAKAYGGLYRAMEKVRLPGLVSSGENGSNTIPIPAGLRQDESPKKLADLVDSAIDPKWDKI